jgi:transcriptional antiterminator NusG
MGLKWYGVHTYSGFENKVKLSLLERIKNQGLEESFGEVLIPSETVIELKKGEKKTTSRKFFPGYILVNMDLNDETWHVVKETAKVTGFVGGNTPVPITEEEISRITRRVEEGALRNLVPRFSSKLARLCGLWMDHSLISPAL